MKNLSKAFSDPKTRNIFIFLGAFSIIVIFVAIGLFKKASAPIQGDDLSGVQIPPPPQLKEQRGAEVTPAIQRMREELDRRQFASAEQTGASAMPSADLYQAPSYQFASGMQPPGNQGNPSGAPQQAQMQAPPQGYPAQANYSAQQNTQLMQQIATLEQNKTKALEGLLARWEPDTGMEMVSISKIETQQSASQGAGVQAAQTINGVPVASTGAAGAAGMNSQGKEEVIFQAGEIITAKIDTLVNTDKPGPVRATILSGPYAGGYMMGTSSRELETAKITFNLLSVPSKNLSVSIEAISLDANTLDTGVATEVDRHLFEKYVLRPGAAGLKSLAQAITQYRQSSTINLTGTTVTSQPLDGSEQATVIAGAIADQISRDVTTGPLNPTVYVDPKKPGSVIGIMFLKQATKRL